MLGSRSMRAETRNRAKDELKRVINSIDKVRKWEKKWIVVKDTTMKIHKWVPVSDPGDSVPPMRKPLLESRSENETESGKTDEDASQETFLGEDSNVGGGASASQTRPTDFSALNDDSNTGFSETGFDSDSNPTFGADSFTNPEDSTDFSLLAAAAEAENASRFISEQNEDSYAGDVEPSEKRLKSM